MDKGLQLALVLKTAEGEQIPPLLFTLFESVSASGSLAGAASAAGVSYRKAWNLIRQWSAYFDTALLHSTRGSGAVLTPFAEKLLWAFTSPQDQLDHAMQQWGRELNAGLAEIREGPTRVQQLVISASHCASHDILEHLYKAHTGNDLQIGHAGSARCLRQLGVGEVPVAGFHLIAGALEKTLVAIYTSCLPIENLRLIKALSRQQGFIVERNNPLNINSIEDLIRADVTMINRQPDSGTRLLLDALLKQSGVDCLQVNGYQNEELTHSAVSALIAGGAADVALGTKAAATQYGLDFIAIASETYYYAYYPIESAAQQIDSLRKLLTTESWRKAVSTLAGYDTTGAGEVFDAPSVLY